MKIIPRQVLVRSDPICGMQLQADQIVFEYNYYGINYAFCSAECRDRFLDGAELYAAHLSYDPNWALGHDCPHERIALALTNA